MDFIGEAMEKRLVCIVIFFSCITPCYSGIFDWFSPAKQKSKVEQLEEKLVDYPQDPEINYNLGVAYYKDKKLNDAIQCFKRAFDYGTDLEIKKRSSFNAGNGLYQSVVAGLPYNWEKKETKVDPQLLVQSIMMAKDAIEQYKKTLSIDPVDIKAKTNKKKAEELLKKLQDKQEQKPQDKQDKKDNQQNKDQQQNQNQQQEQQGDQSKQEKNKGDQNSQNDQQQGQGNDEMKSSSEQQKEAGDKGLDKQESQQKQETKQDHEQTPQQKPEGQQQSPGVQDKPDEGKEQAAAAGAQDQKNSEEKRALGAILDSLKNDEKGLQKGLMMREMQKKQQKDPIKSGQKQW
jgi:Ca-activated chloride channel family protein